MRKIPTLFLRDWNGNKNLVTQEINPECQWVFDGEGVATRKWDGTCCLVQHGKLYKRYELKPGKISPDAFIPAQDADPETGKQPGWIPCTNGPEDQYYLDAWVNYQESEKHIPPDGTYELVGPKVQGNPDEFACHQLVLHGGSIAPDAPRDYKGLKTFLSHFSIEGLVWHHPDGRMAKIKARDFGIPWPCKTEDTLKTSDHPTMFNLLPDHA